MENDRVTEAALLACRLLVKAYCGGLYRAGEFAGPVMGSLDAAYVAAIGAIRAEAEAQRAADAASFHNS